MRPPRVGSISKRVDRVKIPPRVVEALRSRRVDLAFVHHTAPEIHLRDPGLVAQLSSVAETPEIPEAGICVRPGVNAALVQRVKAALLSLTASEHGSLLKKLYDIDGFVEARDQDFDSVREAVDLMGLTQKR